MKRQAALVAAALAVTAGVAAAQDEQINVVAWPRPNGTEVPDLCRAPFVDELCDRDRRIRLGRTGDRGEQRYFGRRLVSRMNDDGAVEWLWHGPAPKGAAAFELADGTRVVLHLPSTAPPRIEKPAPPRIVKPAPPPSSPPPSSPPPPSRRPAKPAPKPPPTSPAPKTAAAPVEAPRSPPPAPPPPLDLPSPVPEPPPVEVPEEPVPAPARPDPKPWLGLPALAGVLVFLALALRRSARRPRKRTSFVRRVGPVRQVDDNVVSDLAWGVPRSPPELPESQDPSQTPSCRFREELDALDFAERQGALQAIDATRRLADWVAAVLPVFREIEAGHGLARLDGLPLASRREWIDAHDALRHFAEAEGPIFELLAGEDAARDAGVDSYLAASDLLDARLPLRERLRRHLLAPVPAGRVHGVVLALQYLLEAFPVEHLEPSERRALRAALRERLLQSGVPPRLHALVSELAAGLGLSYREVRYYKSEVGMPGYAFLAHAHDRISLSARVGFEAGTEGRAVVRLAEIFLFESSTGAYYSGRAAIDEGSASDSQS